MSNTEKSLLHKEVMRRLAALEKGAFLAEGRLAASLITELPVWKNAQTVLLFLSTGYEIDTGPLFEAALSNGKHVYLPRVNGERMSFLRVYSADGPWQYGAFHIREPLTQRPEDSLSANSFPALIITPGAAFDHEGRRLGHGRGYYDRYFAELDGQGFSYTMLGLCMETQIVERVPVESWDKTMDVVWAGGKQVSR
jgi:5-formyltetrahydrofolate cyclo-ligase